MQVDLNNEDIQAFAILAALAHQHPKDLQATGEAHNVEPEWIIGLARKIENALET